MRQLFRKILPCCLCFLPTALAAQEPFNWQAQDYQPHHVDINGDGLRDLLLQPLAENQPGLFFPGTKNSGLSDEPAPIPARLPALINQQSWFVGQTQFVPADFNGDGHDDVLLVLPQAQQIWVYSGTDQGIDFSLEPSLRYSATELPWLAKEQDFDFYPGDFNGDGKQDLLALSQDKHQHYLMHSDDSGQLVIAQEIDKNVKWGKKRSEKLIIRDFNQDGRDDVFALAKKKHQSHYLVLANGAGHLQQSRKISDKLQGKDWNSNDFNVWVGNANHDNTLDIIRLNNMPGGIDEKGEIHLSAANEDTDDIDNICDQMYFSAEGGTGTTCAPWQGSEAEKDGVHAKVEATPGLQRLTEPELPCGIAPDQGHCTPPPTPTSAPVVNGTYWPIGSRITVTFPSLRSGQYYQVYVSNDNRSYDFAGALYSGRTKAITLRSTHGYQYIKYDACFEADICSGLSPWQKVHAYDSPYRASPSASPTTIARGNSATISWPTTSRIIWTGGYYERKYKTPTGAVISQSTMNHVSGSSTTRATTPSLTTAGTYTFYVRACNPQLPCGDWGTTTVTVENKKPVVSPSSPSNNASYPSNQSISASASASDSDGSVTQVEFKLDSGSWQVDSSSPYSKNFGRLSVGSHTIYYRAKDNDGGYSTSPYPSRTFTIQNIKPVVSPLTPSDNASYLSTQSISASASASDSDGSIAQVEFKLDSGSWQADSSSPYSKNFGPLSAGSHTIAYRAKDNLGGYSTTAYRNITVTANQKPTVRALSPSNNASYLTSQNVIATASASDSDGSIAQVEFKLNAGSWQVDNSSPYSRNFGTLSAGNHTIYYRTQDNDGTYSSTDDINITVSAPTNKLPVIGGTPANTATPGEAYQFTPTASDGDNDNLTFSIGNQPAWLSFTASTGTLSGTPTDGNIGTFSNISISVSDGKSRAYLPPFSIDVKAAKASPAVIFIHTDNLGSPVAETDEQGNVL
ncbi:Ig-like domain-containing protein [Thalassomonas actiniarum]|uniref:VCBS repeat-containing protein n=1 Tax=Thalassomonas actiniarum TaxID=485447 RepID=A0AAE9YP12_9GAMM|nr:Ig-like domain-containing protein [Thalassomonas actiniarum]WDD98217.1 VCBS repeat-containing protein [Thalassomonas actiniarum]